MKERKLSHEEIDKRLTRLHNLEGMYARAKASNANLRVKVKKLEEKVEGQEGKIEEQALTVETLLLRIEELEKMIFGGKNGGGGKTLLYGPGKSSKKKKARKKSSYKRSVPKDVDQEKIFEINQCPDCCSILQKKTMATQYIEDILIPSLQAQRAKQVVKENVEKGFCRQCRKWHSAKAIQPQAVMLGENVKTLVLFAINILNLSYSQLKNLLFSLYDFQISDGEIANILARCAKKLLPEYQRIRGKIRGKLANHYDETSWQQGEEKGYAWVQTGGEGEEAVFVVGKSRGKLVAEDLKGDSQAIGISDCYAAYKNLFEVHQICWAHLQRNARDLANSPSLSKTKQKHCGRFYHRIAAIYARLLEFQKEKFDLQNGSNLKAELMKSVGEIRQFHQLDPKKLRKLKERLLIYENALFVCLSHPIAPDNNKAERKLRHLVLKRKNSFGTKTAKGSHAFSINISVTLSHFWSDPKNWFPTIHSLLAA